MYTIFPTPGRWCVVFPEPGKRSTPTVQHPVHHPTIGSIHLSQIEVDIDSRRPVPETMTKSMSDDLNRNIQLSSNRSPGVPCPVNRQKREQRRTPNNLTMMAAAMPGVLRVGGTLNLADGFQAMVEFATEGMATFISIPEAQQMIGTLIPSDDFLSLRLELNGVQP